MSRENYLKGLFIAFVFALGIILGISMWATVRGDIGDKPIHECPKFALWWVDQCIPYWKWFAVKTLTDPIAVFTGLLTIFTLGLFVYTFRLWRAGADQFNLSQKEFIATHRPRIIIRFIQGPLFNDDGFQTAWVTIANVGDTEATIKKFGADLAYMSQMNWLSPGLDASPKPIEPIILVCGQRHHFTVTCKIKQTAFDQTFAKQTLYCIGAIVYADSNGIERRTGFYRGHNPVLERFVPSDNPEQEYQD